jgi:hypothetical protein
MRIASFGGGVQHFLTDGVDHLRRQIHQYCSWSPGIQMGRSATAAPESLANRLKVMSKLRSSQTLTGKFQRRIRTYMAATYRRRVVRRHWPAEGGRFRTAATSAAAVPVTNAAFQSPLPDSHATIGWQTMLRL